MKLRRTPFAILASLMLAGTFGLAGCSSDSPSEPAQPPAPPGGGGGQPQGSFVITVSADPAVLPAAGDETSIIRVQVRRSDNNQPPPNGTTLVVSASAGSFDAAGTQSSAVLQLTNGAAAVEYFPPQDPATVFVQASLQGSIGQARIDVIEPDVLFVSFVSPSVGSPQGGDPVTINGQGFEEPVRVTFGGANAQVQSVSPTQVRVITPPSPSPGNQQAVVDVSVTVNVNEEDEASDSLAGGFTYSPGGGTEVPAVFSVTPGSGPNEGGTRVTIVGEGFVAPVQVIFGQGTNPATFNGQEAQIQSVTSNRIEVLTPAATGIGSNNQNQLVNVLVRNLDSGLATIQTGAFKYGTDVQITAVGPTVMPYFGGGLVTIFGQGFDAPVAVTLAGFGQPTTSVTGTEIVVSVQPITTADCSDVTGPVSVVNIETGDGADSNIDFTYRVEAFSPVLFNVSPNSGPQAGNTLVTLTGTDLRAPLVTFGGRPAATQTVAGDGSSVTVRTPFLPDTLLEEEACDDNGDGTQGQRFLPTAVDVTIENRDTTCDFTFEDAFVYTPSNGSCRNDVGPPPPP